MKKTDHKPILDEALIEALASQTPPVSPTPEAAARMKEKLLLRVHAPVQDYLFVHTHEGEWVNLLKGVELKLLRQDETSRSFLLRMAPGARIPPHEHALDEESLVLEGDATINGVLCLPGDYHMAPQSKSHDWLTTEKGCLLFVRGATDRHAHR